MNALSGENVSQWYALIKEILSDIRGRAFKTHREKLEIYKKLHASLRGIHEDYIRIFTRLIDDLIEATKPGEIERARKRFLTARKTHSADRTLSKFDAQTYLGIATELSEKRYLASVITYFYYQDDRIPYATTLEQIDGLIWEAAAHGGDHGWNSASSAFWIAAQYSNSREELISIAKPILEAIGERFAMTEVTFLELSGNWRNTTTISRSRMTEVLEISGVIKRHETSPSEECK